ncbi:MAG: cytochrome c [Planctomycetes bacterium]|nr:cytochrome c [Planctomycetota bacterium]
MDDAEESSGLETGFGAQSISPNSKAWMLGILVLCFVCQSYLVYTDPTETRALEGQELAGRRVWLANNCQACHQFYGFGGFLGPDLTNAASRLQKWQLADRLALGEGQMPKFDLPEHDIEALWAFLSAMNETGVGQARNPKSDGFAANGTLQDSPKALAVQELLSASNNADATAGFEIYRSSTCVGCHVLFGESAIGAPDLSLSGARLSPEEIRDKLTTGVPPLMPPSALPANKLEQVQAFTTFLAEYREEALTLVEAGNDNAFWSDLPWWEF